MQYLRYLVFVALAVGFTWAIVVAGTYAATWVGVAGETYWSGAIPTVIGVVAGLPLALLLADIGTRLAASRESQAQLEQAQARRSLVLGLIRKELADNLAQLRGERAVRPRPIVLPLLSEASWRALSDGGELEPVGDPDLIAKLARAYHRIETTTLIEREILALSANPLWRTTGWQTISELDPMPDLLEYAEDQDKHTLAAVTVALEALSAEESR